MEKNSASNITLFVHINIDSVKEGHDWDNMARSQRASLISDFTNQVENNLSDWLETNDPTAKIKTHPILGTMFISCSPETTDILQQAIRNNKISGILSATLIEDDITINLLEETDRKKNTTRINNDRINNSQAMR